MSKKNKHKTQKVEEKPQTELNVAVATEQTVEIVSETKDSVIPIQKPVMDVAAALEKADGLKDGTVMKVDFKKAYEAVARKKELPVDVKFVVGAKEIMLHSSFTGVLASIIVEKKGDEVELPLIVSRRALLELFCGINEISPLPCKRSNKTENKANATYGNVPEFEAKFDSNDTHTYKLLGGLSYPIIRADEQGFVAIKYDTYYIVMTPDMYEQVSKGVKLEDVNVSIIA